MIELRKNKAKWMMYSFCKNSVITDIPRIDLLFSLLMMDMTRALTLFWEGEKKKKKRQPLDIA